jgi:hypothetical protein
VADRCRRSGRRGLRPGPFRHDPAVEHGVALGIGAAGRPLREPRATRAPPQALDKWLIPSATVMLGVLGYVVQSAQESLLGVEASDRSGAA